MAGLGKGGFQGQLEALKSRCWCTGSTSCSRYHSQQEAGPCYGEWSPRPVSSGLSAPGCRRHGWSREGCRQTLRDGSYGQQWMEGRRCTVSSPRLRAGTWAETACLPIFQQVSPGCLSSPSRPAFSASGPWHMLFLLNVLLSPQRA